MIKQIKYFQAVVRFQNFTKAAEECFISQSAISQQIQALENELGVKLFHRERRKISLTQAGEFFYRKSLILVNDFDRLIAETLKLSTGFEQEISIGYLKNFGVVELKKTLQEFQIKRPEISINLFSGTHEELYNLLRTGKIDVVINDLRRNPSDQYVNFFLAEKYIYAELPEKNSLAQLEFLTMEDLKNTPIILISSQNQERTEENFYKEYFGVKSEIIFVETLEEAHLNVISNNGYFFAEFIDSPQNSDGVKFIPIFHKDKQIFIKYYAFWRADSLKNYIEEFAEILKRNF